MSASSYKWLASDTFNSNKTHCFENKYKISGKLNQSSAYLVGSEYIDDMPIKTPEWVKQAVFYQIFPDRFARTKQHHLTPPMRVSTEPWDSPPTVQGYKGGDLWGIIENLEHIQQLGCTAIYLNPVFQSASNHRYHTHDYYQVDPLLGGNQALEDLLDAAHGRGLKVILDGVFNHASRGFFFFNDILENGPNSPWLDWFKVTKWPISAYDGCLPANYECWVDNRSLPEFNHANPLVKEYIMQIGEYWIDFGIDGWRLDVPYEVTEPGFWEEFRTRIKAINPEAYIVGEIWDDARQWLDGKQFDGVMNYLFAEAAIAFVVADKVLTEHTEPISYNPTPALDAAGYGSRIKELVGLYDWEIQLTQLNLIASHDTARLLTIAGGETGEQEALDFALESIQLCTLLLLTFPGAPCIYYGDEVGLGGSIDPDCRRGFPREPQWHHTILQCHKDLIQLRRHYPALQTGIYQTCFTHYQVYGFIRQLEVNGTLQSIFIVVNVGDTCYNGCHSMDKWGQFIMGEILYGNGTCSTSHNQIELEIPPRQGLMLELK